MGTTYLLYFTAIFTSATWFFRENNVAFCRQMSQWGRTDSEKKDYRIKLKQFLAPFIISQIQSQDPLFYKNRSGGLGNLNIFKPGFLFYFGGGGCRSGYRLLPEYLLLLIVLILNSICIILYIMISIRISGPKGQCSLIR